MKDALYWANRIQKKEISLAEYFLEIDKKIDSINPKINGLVEWPTDELMKIVDHFSLNAPLPFSGIPIPLKMLGQDKKGWKATEGARLFQEVRASSTSNFVKKLKKNGFILAGQTNAPEFGFKNITDPLLYGPARNPWNAAYSPGGSSGGAAAVVSSGIFPIAAASDGGGSIRIPASFTSLIGLKPTRGSMPNGPSSWRGWQGASINFALTLSMRDTETLFYGLRGNQKAAPYHSPIQSLGNDQVTKKMKIAYFTESPVKTAVSNEAILAVKNICTELEKMGHQLTEIKYPVNGCSLISSYYLMNGAETAAMFDSFAHEVTIDDVELMTWGIYQYGKKILSKEYIHALNMWDQAAAVMEELFLTYDLLLSPTTAYTAPKITDDLQSDLIRETLSNAEQLSEKELKELVFDMFNKSVTLSPYTQLANLTGQPAISLPTHITKEGMPLGIQFMASKGREDLLFSVGKQIEALKLFKFLSN